jgi:hypothetical protein
LRLKAKVLALIGVLPSLAKYKGGIGVICTVKEVCKDGPLDSTQPALTGDALQRDTAVRHAGPVLEGTHAASLDRTEQGMVRLSIAVQDLCVIP